MLSTVFEYALVVLGRKAKPHHVCQVHLTDFGKLHRMALAQKC